jgi:hypothetical protein
MLHLSNIFLSRLSDNEFKINAGIKGCFHLRDVDQLIKRLPQFREAFEEVVEVEDVEQALNSLADNVKQWLVERVFSQKDEPDLCTQWEVGRTVVYEEFSLSGIKQPKIADGGVILRSKQFVMMNYWSFCLKARIMKTKFWGQNGGKKHCV